MRERRGDKERRYCVCVCVCVCVYERNNVKYMRKPKDSAEANGIVREENVI